MIILIKLISITVIWVLGLTIVTQQDMALHNIRLWAKQKGNKIWEPIILCEWCMPSLHSLISYIFAFGIGVLTKFSFKLIWMYPLVVMGSSLVCGLIWSAYTLISLKIKYYQNEEDVQQFQGGGL